MRHIFSIFLLLPAIAWADDDKVARLKKNADEVCQAVLKENHEKLIDLTHPKVVEITGGRAKMLKILKEIATELADQGIKFESIDLETPEPIVVSGTHEFSVVPYVLRISKGKTKLRQKNYLLGVSADAGKTWRFINGPIPDSLRKAIDDFPAKLELPKEEKAMIEKD